MEGCCCCCCLIFQSGRRWPFDPLHAHIRSTCCQEFVSVRDPNRWPKCKSTLVPLFTYLRLSTSITRTCVAPPATKSCPKLFFFFLFHSVFLFFSQLGRWLFFSFVQRAESSLPTTSSPVPLFVFLSPASLSVSRSHHLIFYLDFFDLKCWAKLWALVTNSPHDFNICKKKKIVMSMLWCL